MKFFRKITPGIIASLVMVCLAVIPKNVSAQVTNNQAADSVSKDSVVFKWLQDLAEESVSLTGDSVKISDETNRLLTEATYRQLMYPKTYSWETAVYFIQKQDIKRACWFLLNLYRVNDTNKELVVKSLLTYDKIFKMDKVLVNAFYTYVLTDTEIGSVADGHFNVTAPHVMEQKLNTLKEILFYLEKFRPKEQKGSSDKQ